MDQLRVLAAGTRRKVIFLYQRHAQTGVAKHQVAGNTRPVDAAADNEHIPRLASKSVDVSDPPVLHVQREVTATASSTRLRY